MIERAWAIRTSRDDEEIRKFLWEELLEGRLRQGWGYDDRLDLRRIHEKIQNNLSLDEEERDAWKQWRMLGEESGSDLDCILVGDIVLVPNMPEDGFFTLCKAVGKYEYDVDNKFHDFRHILPVEVLEQTIANDHPVVDAELRRTLRCRSRLWWIGGYLKNIEEILRKAEENGPLSHGSGHYERAHIILSGIVDDHIDSIASQLPSGLSKSLRGEEWEPVVQAALRPLMTRVDVRHIGGPGEKGADLEIAIPNPFDPDRSWVVLVQIKDYEGEVGAEVAEQLERAFVSRGDGSLDVISVYLAATRAKPSAALEERLEKLSQVHHCAFSFVGGKDLMRMLARGFTLIGS